MDQDSSIKILSPDKATPYITNDFYIGWVASQAKAFAQQYAKELQEEKQVKK